MKFYTIFLLIIFFSGQVLGKNNIMLNIVCVINNDSYVIHIKNRGGEKALLSKNYVLLNDYNGSSRSFKVKENPFANKTFLEIEKIIQKSYFVLLPQQSITITVKDSVKHNLKKYSFIYFHEILFLKPVKFYYPNFSINEFYNHLRENDIFRITNMAFAIRYI